MAEFSKQIIFEASTAAAFHPLNKKVPNKRFEIAKLVHIRDRLLKKHPDSLRDALGKMKEVASTAKDYVIEPLDWDTVKRHYSDIASASVARNQDNTTLINPFQLVDHKNKNYAGPSVPKVQTITR